MQQYTHPVTVPAAVTLMNMLHFIAFVLVVVGAINWGLVGLGGFMGSSWNLVNMLLGSWPMVEWLVYVLVGLSGLYLVFTHKRDCSMCMSHDGGM